MAQEAELDDPTNLLASVNDDLLRHVFAFLGPCYINVTLTCHKFNNLLLEDECVPCCERPLRCHPPGASIERGPEGFCWSCCEGSVKDPGCETGDMYQHENDLEWERHNRYYDCDLDDLHSVDSSDWCERHCGCGYADNAYAYCLQGSVKESYPRGFHSDIDSDERSSDEADSENNSSCSGTVPPSKKRTKREQESSGTSDDEDHDETNSCSRSIGTTGGSSPTERTKIAKDSEHDDESNSEYE